MRKFLVIPLALLMSYHTGAQDDFIDYIDLRKSFDTKDDKAEPAMLSCTWPRDDTASVVANLAVAINWQQLQGLKFQLKPVFEYHKNTETDKEQENIKGGLYMNWIIRDASDTNSFIPQLMVNAGYSDDRIKKVSSFQAQYYFTVFRQQNRDEGKYFWLPNNLCTFGKLAKFEYNPYLGLEQENRIKADTDSLQGSKLRAMFKVRARLYLLPDLLRDRVELSAEYQWRYNFVNTTQEPNEIYPFLLAQVNLIVFKPGESSVVKIGFDYNKGQNPVKGFENQDYKALALKVMF